VAAVYEGIGVGVVGGAVRIGNGLGGLAGLEVVNQNSTDRAAFDVLAAPSNAVNMTIPAVWTHQFSVVLPIR